MSNAPVTLPQLAAMKQRGEKIAVLTAYDASFAALMDQAGVEIILVGDSLGMVIQGQRDTLPVTMDDMIYHTRNVRRGSRRALVMADMPFMSCATPELALQNAGQLMKAGAAMVKIEGAADFVPTVALLGRHGIPVCAHLGLLPQSVHKLGGYRVQGRDEAVAARMIEDATAMVAAGADMLLLECVPAALAGTIAREVPVPVIGIGAGADVDAQVLVLYDMLGMGGETRPRFVQDFLNGQASIADALRSYVSAVKCGDYPRPEHSY